MVKIKRENIRIEKIGKELEIGKTYKIDLSTQTYKGKYEGHTKDDIVMLHGFLHLFIFLSEWHGFICIG